MAQAFRPESSSEKPDDHKIHNACIAIECRTEELQKFREHLFQTLSSQKIACEFAAPSMHISIAYGVGEVKVECLERVLADIAERGFQTQATGFDILEGRTTPYDYLVLNLDACRDFDSAVESVEEEMPTRKFRDGFKSHVSLLKFVKGSLTKTYKKFLIRELNASHSAAFALGRCVSVEGDCVCVFGPEHEARLRVEMSSARVPAL